MMTQSGIKADGGHPGARYLSALATVAAAALFFIAVPPTQAVGGSAVTKGPANTTQTTLCNSTLITIPQYGPSTPYPSQITVSGLGSPIRGVSVQLHGLRHDFYGDIDMALVGPDQKSTVLMSDTCDICAARGIDINFQDGMPPLPDRVCPVSGATYRPTNYDYPGWPTDYYPGLPPFLSWNTNLAVYKGDDPNGVWRLDVVDDFGLFSGQITNGWCLAITTDNTNK